MSDQPEIYFHVGLGKVASTYLQHRVFPKLEGIYYIPTVRYRRSKEIIAKGKHKKYLVSREFDRQFEEEVKWFTETYPETKIIILFRHHDSWIASQYRRFVKNGWHWNFDKFFNLDDTAWWKKSDLIFFKKLETIEECTPHKPLVLFHEELKADPWVFFDKISNYSNTSYTKEKVSLKPVHKSYTEKQLLVLRAYCRKFKKKPPEGRQNKVLHWLLYRPWWAYFHLIMYIASTFPRSWVPKQKLYEQDALDKIRTAFSDDWNKLKEYAARNNPS